MSDKSTAKKQLILERSRDLFCKMGYQQVTMKDVVDACGISRGGLYLYYGNTHDLFLDVLEMENAGLGDENEFMSHIPEDASAAKIIGHFLKEEKKEILDMTDTLTVATYEFFFKHFMDAETNPLRRNFDTSVEILASLILRGIENGELYDVDPRTAARNVLFLTEGMKIAARTMDIDKTIIDQQLMYIIDTLMVTE
ncbi:MAG: TetR/AcrR family transcriptional regulator [Lachnospiraceae bacterium]|nr:TetR/AcrR family transcriptional regulator [Lachnospiraceae bacterium]